MNALIDLLEDAQPGYETSVQAIVRRFIQYLGESAFDGIGKEGFVARAIERFASPDVDPGVRLQLISDLGQLAWWCGLALGDANVGALSALSRRTHHQAAQAIQLRIEHADPAARTAHAVFAGSFVSRLHSPTRGAFDYIAALARDPENRRIDVYFGGANNPEIHALAVETLGADFGRVRFVHIGENPNFLGQVTNQGACTFHFWCEEAHAIHVSLMSLMGPTVMFTCGDAAPVQFADVYWYCHEAPYIEDLWRRQGAPERFIANYRQIESCPFPQDPPTQKRTRAELGLREDEVVLVTVGNRLGVDMDQPFVDGMARLVLENPKARWLMVGRLQDFWINAFTTVLGDQFLHVPYDADLPSLFPLTDVFVNPFRAGGGTTAIMAVDKGAQVLTRADVGDVGAFVPAAHRAADAEAFFGILQDLVSDPALRAARLAEQEALMARRLDQDLFARELKDLTALAYERFAGRLPVSMSEIFAQPQPKRLALKGSGRRARLR